MRQIVLAADTEIQALLHVVYLIAIFLIIVLRRSFKMADL